MKVLDTPTQVNDSHNQSMDNFLAHQIAQYPNHFCHCVVLSISLRKHSTAPIFRECLHYEARLDCHGRILQSNSNIHCQLPFQSFDTILIGTPGYEPVSYRNTIHDALALLGPEGMLLVTCQPRTPRAGCNSTCVPQNEPNHSHPFDSFRHRVFLESILGEQIINNEITISYFESDTEDTLYGYSVIKQSHRVPPRENRSMNPELVRFILSNFNHTTETLNHLNQSNKRQNVLLSTIKNTIPQLNHHIQVSQNNAYSNQAIETRFKLKPFLRQIERLHIRPALKKLKRAFQDHSKSMPEATFEFDTIQAIDSEFDPLRIMGRTTFKNATIITTPHAYYIARLIQSFLSREGVKSEITHKPSSNQLKSKNTVYFVICPQMFRKLPKKYFAFQLEQATSSRWFTQAYIKLLKNSQAVLDYSDFNINYLEHIGIPYQKLYSVPIGPIRGYFDHQRRQLETAQEPGDTIEVLFYGDTSSPRRQDFLNALQDKFKVVVASKLFGSQMIDLLLSAKVVINIHYYDDALLETTRIFECISLGIPVISESSIDQNDYHHLHGIVEFTPTGDIQSMVEAISQLLSSPGALAARRERVIEFAQNDKTFEANFARFLYAQDLLSFEALQDYYSIPANSIRNAIGYACLTINEMSTRRRRFQEMGLSSTFPLFNGLRHKIGWIGCGSSYKFMLQEFLNRSCRLAFICEDDVTLCEDSMDQFNKVIDFLENAKAGWHVFCGVIAHLNPDTEILGIEERDGIQYIFINKMTSMVCNIYSASGMHLLGNWQENIYDQTTNTIDRYLENQSDLVAITTIPFLAGHSEEQQSTLWNISNKKYTKQINESARLLSEKVAQFRNKAIPQR